MKLRCIDNQPWTGGPLAVLTVGKIYDCELVDDPEFDDWVKVLADDGKIHTFYRDRFEGIEQ